MGKFEGQGDKVKVAVLGGGMGGLAAAWQLVKLDPQRYDITVYQRGWRLGGKGASGRNRQPGKSLRIEEHGLHILMGFYEHVFYILKSCYDDLGPTPAQCPHGIIGPWLEALSGSNHIHVYDRYRDGHAEIWELELPPKSDEAPGARPPDEPEIAQWIRGGLAFIYQAVRQAYDPSFGANPGYLQFDQGTQSQPWLDKLAQTLVRRGSEGGPLRANLLGEATKASIRWSLSLLFQRLGDPERRDPLTVARRREAMTAYFVGANLLGIVNERLWCKADFQRVAKRLDALDYRQWLHSNTGNIGARWPELAWDSPLVQSVYDLIFSRGSGFGAGTALYDTLCMLLNYRGQVYYRMNGGMGDVVFAPLYLWLRRHGVKFRFFNRVRKLQVDASPAGRQAAARKWIQQITVEEQIDLEGAEYDPLFAARGRPCWPSSPLLERLPARERERALRSGYDFETSEEEFGRTKQLRRGRDFDLAVLAIPIGALQYDPALTADLAATHAPFAEMIRGIRTVGTRALQIWTDQDSPGLGWRSQPGMMGTYQRPFGSWADMSQVLIHEAWEGDRPAKGVHYFCDVYEGREPSGDAGPTEPHPTETVRRDAIQWLEASLPGLLPGWTWERMCAAEGRGQERFAAQYWRANVSPSDRYVLAAPGTLRFRLAPDESGFENLFLAGDWVKTDLNAGCVEAAAMAGVGAARAMHERSGDGIVRGPGDQVLEPRSHASPLYVDRDSDWVLRAPVRAEEVTTAAFVLRADPEALIELCKDQINGPTAGEVTAEPWPARAGVVVLLCSDMPRVESADTEHGRIGSFHEHDVGFFVPIDVRTRAGRQAIGFLPPYLFVDSALGLTAGREIYGFSKLLAHIDMPGLREPGSGHGPLVTVRSDVLPHPATGAPGTGAARRVELATVLEVLDGGSPSSSPRSVLSGAVGRDVLAPRPGLWRFLPDLIGRSLSQSTLPLTRASLRMPGFGVPMLFLKQFRDASAPIRACHQSLVLCGARATLQGTPRRLQGSFLVRLPSHFKPDVAGTLGLRNEVETHLAVRLRHDLFLPGGTQLWP